MTTPHVCPGFGLTPSQSHRGSVCSQRSQKLTVTAVKEFSDDGGTAGRPRASAIDLNERG